MGIPACFYPMGYPTYSLTGKNDTNTGYTAKLTRKTQSYYPKDVMELRMDVMYETSSRLHIKVKNLIILMAEIWLILLVKMPNIEVEEWIVTVTFPTGNEDVLAM